MKYSLPVIEGKQRGFIMAVEVNEELCVGCGACVDVCPVEALAMKKNNKVGCDADKCIDCGQCVNECPEGALSL